MGELGLSTTGFIGFQSIDSAAVIDDQQFAIAIGAEANDPQGRVQQLPMPGNLFIVTQSPNLAGDVIAVDIFAGEQRMFPTVIHVAAGDAQRLGVRMLNRRREDRRGAALAVGIHRLAALHDAPAIVSTALHLVNHLHAFPTDIAHPQVAFHAIETHPPRITHAVGPHFAAGSWHFHKGIIRRNAICAAFVSGIHINAQNAAEQIANVLAGFQAVRRAGRGSVAGGNVQHAVRTKAQTAAVMAATDPGDDLPFGG